MSVTSKPKLKLKKKPVVKKTEGHRKVRGRLTKKDIKQKIETLVARGEFNDEYNFDDLSENDKYFCELFASDREFYGNGTQAFIEAYKPNMALKGAYDRAKWGAFDRLTKPNFLAYINHVMEVGKLNDTFVDLQHAFLIIQNADFKTKMQAIKHYDIKKGRIIRKFKLDKHTHHHVTPEEAEMLEEIFGADEDDD